MQRASSWPTWATAKKPMARKTSPIIRLIQRCSPLHMRCALIHMEIFMWLNGSTLGDRGSSGRRRPKVSTSNIQDPEKFQDPKRQTVFVLGFWDLRINLQREFVQ